jgi:hypothetical protein
MKREELAKRLAGRDPKILHALAEHFFETRVTRLEGGRWLLAEAEWLEETVLDDDDELVEEILALANDTEED